MDATTGITDRQLSCLVEHTATLYDQGIITYGCRCIPDIQTRVVVVLMYLRLNIPQQVIAELYGISQATVSRLINVLGEHLCAYLRRYIPTIESMNPNEDIIIDGTLCPTVDCQDHLRKLLR